MSFCTSRVNLTVVLSMFTACMSGGQTLSDSHPVSEVARWSQAIMPVPRIHDCGRAAFEYVETFHEYDLVREAQRLEQLRTTNRVDGQKVELAAKSLAAMLGVPVQSSARERKEFIEVAFMRLGKQENERHLWTQLLARYVPEDRPWLLACDAAPERMTIYRDGVEHFWIKADAAWSRTENNGVFLVPPFDQFGIIAKYLKGELSDSNLWVRTESRTADVIRIVWRSVPTRANREVGIEVTVAHPERLLRAWWGKIDAPSNVDVYSNYMENVGGGRSRWTATS